MKRIFLLLVVVFSLSGCEKDDICDANTVTTPRLVIEFYDNNIATPTLKNVTGLNVIAQGYTTPITFSGVSKIQIPLKTTGDTTTFSFILNSGDNDPTNDNEDILQFNYTRNNIFVSRACGYKTLFNLNDTNPIIQSEPTTPDGIWMDNITIVKSNLESENEVHVQIRF